MTMYMLCDNCKNIYQFIMYHLFRAANDGLYSYVFRNLDDTLHSSTQHGCWKEICIKTTQIWRKVTRLV